MNIKSAQMKLFRGFTLRRVLINVRPRGFTLIELLIVIAILGILSAAVLVAINPAKRTKQAQDAKRKNDVGALATEIQGFYTSPGAGTYPSSLSVLVVDQYLKQMPQDPTSNLDYNYDWGTGETAVWATIASPTSGTGSWLWCWESTSGKASETTAGTCTD